jgi:hypothetical protein
MISPGAHPVIDVILRVVPVGEGRFGQLQPPQQLYPVGHSRQQFSQFLRSKAFYLPEKPFDFGRHSNHPGNIVTRRRHCSQLLFPSWFPSPGLADCETGERQPAVQLPNSYDYVYLNGQGDYILTNNANFNPNVEFRSDGWRQMERARC